MREQRPTQQRVKQVLADQLRRECSGLLGHRTAEVVGSLSDPAPQAGMLPTWLCRVKVGSADYMFKLTRQSDFDGGDPRDRDGFERCWLVWEVKRDTRGGGGVAQEAPLEPVPT